MSFGTPITELTVDITPRPRFQVLALDGGGVRGIFAAALLAGLEEDIGRPVVEHFDLVVGTSTGGIIALGLGAGLTPGRSSTSTSTEKGTIFAQPARVAEAAPARSRQVPARRAPERRCGGSSATPCSARAGSRWSSPRTTSARTPSTSSRRRTTSASAATTACRCGQCGDGHQRRADVLPGLPPAGDHVRLIDGGVWANNPAMVGVTEAVSMFGRRWTRSASSASARRRARSAAARLDNAGLLRWVRRPNVVEVLLNGQSAGAFAQVQHLIGAENAHRLNPPAPDELGALDRCDARDLIAKAAHHSRLFCPDFEAVFGAHAPAPYAPFHGPNAKAGSSCSTTDPNHRSTSCSATSIADFDIPDRCLRAAPSPATRHLGALALRTTGAARPEPRARSIRRARSGSARWSRRSTHGDEYDVDLVCRRDIPEGLDRRRQD